MNPFKYGCVVRGENFCPRPVLEKQLRSFAADGQNLVIQGERRMGKTSLVKQAIGTMRGMRMVYVDLYCVKTMPEFCARVMNGVSRASSELPFLHKALQYAFKLRPVLSVDPRDGSTSISVDARASAQPDSLGAVMGALEKIAGDGRTCVVFDEFQDVLKLPNSDGVLAEMRSSIQFQDRIAYFFMGSIRNEMMRIFDDMDSPFYKSALTFAVDAIDPVSFTKFIVERFSSGDRRISPAVAMSILSFADSVSGDVQELCEALWETTGKGDEIRVECFDAALRLVFSREIRGYETIVESLTPSQYAILRGLAADGSAKVCSAEFSERCGYMPATVKAALKRLMTDRIVFRRKTEYRFSNPFFREWLLRA